MIQYVSLSLYVLPIVFFCTSYVQVSLPYMFVPVFLFLYMEPESEIKNKHLLIWILPFYEVSQKRYSVFKIANAIILSFKYSIYLYSLPIALLKKTNYKHPESLP